MTNDERNLIASFVQRVAGSAGPGSVPAAGQSAVAPLPPVDREADALLADLFTRYPEARYRITQLAYVQEHALIEAQNRINRLQWDLENARQQKATLSADGGSVWGSGAAAAQGGQSRGIFGSLFGNSRPAAAPPPQYAPQPQYAQPQFTPPPPSYPPSYNPGLFPQQGTGFFGSALRTAAGVAGGVLAADAISSLFSGHSGFGGGGFGGGGFGGGGFGAPEVIENVTVYGAPPAGNPWGGGDPLDQGGAPKYEDGGKFGAPPTVDQSAWSPAPDQGGGWQDAPADDSSSGGWDDASNDSSSDYSSDS
jgi:hypothetical protein